MRKIVVVMTIALTVTGGMLAFPEPFGAWVSEGRMVALIHLWVGLFFLVAFPLYAWEHIGKNRRWLRRAALVTFSGSSQTLAAVVLILSGIVLYLYGSQAWATARWLHHWSTYLLAAALLLHFLARKSTAGNSTAGNSIAGKSKSP
jgi:cytochrome b subunit of formate dehydrogenase